MEHPRKCLVCGAKATGIYYSVQACTACRSFYRRCLKKKTVTYQCRFNNTCSYNVHSPDSTWCRACRYRKYTALSAVQDGKMISEGKLLNSERRIMSDVAAELARFASVTGAQRQEEINSFWATLNSWTETPTNEVKPHWTKSQDSVDIHSSANSCSDSEQFDAADDKAHIVRRLACSEEVNTFWASLNSWVEEAVESPALDYLKAEEVRSYLGSVQSSPASTCMDITSTPQETPPATPSISGRSSCMTLYNGPEERAYWSDSDESCSKRRRICRSSFSENPVEEIADNNSALQVLPYSVIRYRLPRFPQNPADVLPLNGFNFGPLHSKIYERTLTFDAIGASIERFFGDQIASWTEFRDQILLQDIVPAQPQTNVETIAIAINQHNMDNFQRTQAFATSLPGISDLEVSCRRTLWTEWKILVSALIHLSPFIIDGESYFTIGPQQYRYCRYWQEHERVTTWPYTILVYKLVNAIRDIGLTDIERYLLIVVVLLEPGDGAVPENERITMVHRHYLDVLTNVIYQRCSDPAEAVAICRKLAEFFDLLKTRLQAVRQFFSPHMAPPCCRMINSTLKCLNSQAVE